MVDFIDAVDMLHLGVDNARFVFKKWRKIPAGNITILVDGGGEDRAPVFLKPAGIVGAAAKEGNAKRSPADNHDTGCFSRIFRFNLIFVDFKVSSTAVLPNFSFNRFRNRG